MATRVITPNKPVLRVASHGWFDAVRQIAVMRALSGSVDRAATKFHCGEGRVVLGVVAWISAYTVHVHE